MAWLKKIFLFVLFLCLICLGAEKVFDFFILKNLNIKSSYIYSHKDINADILVLGDCAVLYMKSPDEYTGLTSYNLATNHASYAENYANLYLYLKGNKAPAYLLLSVTVQSMVGFNVFNTHFYAPFLDDSVIAAVVKKEDRDYYRLSSVPFMKYAFYNKYTSFNMVQGAIHYFTGKKFPHYANGYWKIPNADRIKDPMNQYPGGTIFPCNGNEEYYLSKIVLLARQAGTRVIFIKPPVLKETMSFFKNRNEITQRINILAKLHHADFWNFEDMDIADSRQYFFAKVNLDEEGAAVFIQALAEKFNREYPLHPMPKEK